MSILKTLKDLATYLLAIGLLGGWLSFTTVPEADADPINSDECRWSQFNLAGLPAGTEVRVSPVDPSMRVDIGWVRSTVPTKTTVVGTASADGRVLVAVAAANGGTYKCQHGPRRQYVDWRIEHYPKGVARPNGTQVSYLAGVEPEDGSGVQDAQIVRFTYAQKADNVTGSQVGYLVCVGGRARLIGTVSSQHGRVVASSPLSRSAKAIRVGKARTVTSVKVSYLLAKYSGTTDPDRAAALSEIVRRDVTHSRTQAKVWRALRLRHPATAARIESEIAQLRDVARDRPAPYTVEIQAVIAYGNTTSGEVKVRVVSVDGQTVAGIPINLTLPDGATFTTTSAPMMTVTSDGGSTIIRINPGDVPWRARHSKVTAVAQVPSTQLVRYSGHGRPRASVGPAPLDQVAAEAIPGVIL